MSGSSSDQAIAEAIVTLQLFQLSNYATLAAFVLYFYDFFLTFPTEVQSIWSSSRLTGSSILFILIRYGFLIALALELVSSLPLGKLADTRDLALTVRVSSIIADAAGKCGLSSFFNESGLMVHAHILVNVIAPLLQGTFESIIFILTLVRTIRHVRNSRKYGFHSIAEAVLHDGILYFLTIFIAASIEAAVELNLLIFPGAVISIAGEQVSAIIVPLLSMYGSLPGLLLNRFVLNLRTFSNLHAVQYSGQGHSKTTPLSARHFADNRWIGNIGAPLDPNQWDEVDKQETSDGVDQGDGEIEGKFLHVVVDPLSTLVPVIYEDGKGGPVSFVPMQRECDLSQLIA
ncbi:hypothetical protein BDP27DRAFT_1426068 [Rhodocollybia butyracea]|uniref:DUF6533 domain-containing protein n=1 Tax=Rhodocollybia butyracea TaxID=206335 RepID=A0A9P5U370_9AGAR|nr:hypothetical protein BDP27DRAFT_1426068 [Rhodocollybia butyracea]